jgi:hypothetical protein
MPEQAECGFRTLLAALVCCRSRAVLVDACLVEAPAAPTTPSAREGFVARLLQEQLVALEVISALERTSPYHDRFHNAVVSALIAVSLRYATQ